MQYFFSHSAEMAYGRIKLDNFNPLKIQTVGHIVFYLLEKIQYKYVLKVLLQNQEVLTKKRKIL